MTDPIADFLTRIRNAQLANHVSVVVRVSKLRTEILRILQEEGYIDSYDLSTTGHANAEVKLKYFESEPVIKSIKRESSPGRRVYIKHNNIPDILGGLGLCIVSTSHGVMSGADAKSKRLGGELVCTVY